MPNRVDILCNADRRMMLDFSRLCLSRLGNHLAFTLLLSIFEDYLDANVHKEIEKDRLIIRRSADAFDNGGDRAAVNVDELFEMTKRVDEEFLRGISGSLFSLRINYSDIAEIRRKRILSIIGMVFDLLLNWDEGLPFSEVVKLTFGEEQYGRILREILHLYNLETKLLSSHVFCHGPASKLQGLFAEKLFDIMESAAGEIAGSLARLSFVGKACSDAGFPRRR
jgi:hypothetical protein